MGTVIRPELSVKNRYWLPKHRFYELRHFCLQYPEWKKNYFSSVGIRTKSDFAHKILPQGTHTNPTADSAEERLFWRERMEMVEKAAREAADDLYIPLLKAVTEGISYEHLNAQEPIPCCKDVWYVMYRRFFWCLDKLRN